MPQRSDKLRRLTKRSQFLRAARGKRTGRTGFGLQMVESGEPLAGIGFTVTKKTGNAVERNRIKRRLRAAAQACAEAFLPQHDYVLVGRREALGENFVQLTRDLGSAVRRVHAPQTKSLRNGSR
jgi:ribonuclease P protein component